MSLADALDRILDRGVSLQGNLTIGLADVDLLFLDLRVLLGSVDTIWPEGPPPVAPICPRTSAPGAPELSSPPSGIATAEIDLEAVSNAKTHLPQNFDQAVEFPPTETHVTVPAQCETPRSRRDEQRVENSAGDALIAPAVGRDDLGGSSTAKGLVKLVLTVVKLLHDVLEKQAVRRMEAGRLTDVQIDNLGMALLAQAQEILCLQRQFGFSEQDLSLDLGVADGTL